MKRFPVAVLTVLALVSVASADAPKPEGPPGPLPAGTRLAFSEDWAGGKIDPSKWYLLRKKWGEGNNGVVPENVRVERDTVGAEAQNVLVCEAHGDQYEGAVAGEGGRTTRVGGVIVSRPYFASGRFEVVMKLGSARPQDGGPARPASPAGSVPAVWTYAYRYVRPGSRGREDFSPDAPLYNPFVARGARSAMYWSELDFPEYGKAGEFGRAMYNTFCQDRHHPELFDVGNATDGAYHTYTTEWRTTLDPLPGVTDAQAVERLGYWWVNDKAVPYERYLGNPLKRLDKDHFAVHRGLRADHWIDGRPTARNATFVPAMAAQLNLGVWLPDWAGPAAWQVSRVAFASVKVWQYHDPGDVRGVLTEPIGDSFDKDGQPLR